MRTNIAVVTGASRGLGRGIARTLGGRGFKVYITGRSLESLEDSAEEVNSAGGEGIPVMCDHADDEQVKMLFERIKMEAGCLDILVNNAAAVDARSLAMPGPFWEKPLALADMIDIGLRSNYVAAYHAAPLMVTTGGSLIANISFYGAVSYHCGPAYGAAKAGTDKMTFDMAVDLRPYNVTAVSIWPGLILTDALKSIPREHLPPQVAADLSNFEMPEFTGLVIERLWRDPSKLDRSGETLISAELGMAYGIRDLDGKQPRLYTETLGRPTGRFMLPITE